jgi:hypothetical protein
MTQSEYNTLGYVCDKYECLNVEFKEFCLKLDTTHLFDIDKLTSDGRMSNDDIYNFNNVILNTLTKYIFRYIPRYSSAFLNSNIKNSQLYIGIDDFSEITGIPFFGTKEELSHYINNLDYSKFINQKIDINIEVKQLEINYDYLCDNSDKILQDYNFRKHQKMLLTLKYKNAKKKWNQDLYEYTCKLPMLLHDKRHDFDVYLDKHAPHMKNFTIKDNEMRNIEHLKNDPTHYIYWLMQFKDENISKIKDNKPLKPIMPKLVYGPNFLFTQLTDMRYKFLKKNNNINYFLITVNFPSNLYKNPVYYFDIDKKNWRMKKRIYNSNNGPCCL